MEWSIRPGCVDCPEDTVELTVEVCPAWEEYAVSSWRRSAAATSRTRHWWPGGVGSSHLLRTSDASEGGGEAFAGVACCRPTPPPPPGATDVARRSPTIVGAGLRAASSSRVAPSPIELSPCRRRVVLHARLKELSAVIVGPRYWANCLPGSPDPFKRDTAHPGTWAIEGAYRIFIQ